MINQIEKVNTIGLITPVTIKSIDFFLTTADKIVGRARPEIKRPKENEPKGRKVKKSIIIPRNRIDTSARWRDKKTEAATADNSTMWTYEYKKVL
ncbi:hypothetical protein ACFL0L_01830 [Patescibacteria group bacterium]